MARVCRASGLVALIDRVTCDDLMQTTAHNRLEKLRTPNKVHVYSENELIGILESGRLTVIRRELVIQPMDFKEWMAAAGAVDRMEQARGLLFGPAGEDRTGLAPCDQSGRLVIHHHTLILVANPADCRC